MKSVEVKKQSGKLKHSSFKLSNAPYFLLWQIKKMNKYLKLSIKIYISLLLFIVTSSNSLFGQYEQIKNCVNRQTVETTTINYDLNITDFDIFDSIQKFENYLIRTKLLKDNGSESYCNFISKKIEKERKFEIVKMFKFLFELNEESSSWLIIYNNCPSIVGRMKKEWAEELWKNYRDLKLSIFVEVKNKTIRYSTYR